MTIMLPIQTHRQSEILLNSTRKSQVLHRDGTDLLPLTPQLQLWSSVEYHEKVHHRR